MKFKTVLWACDMKSVGVWLATLSCAGLANAQNIIIKADNGLPLNTPASWAGGAVPGAADTAVWDATVTGANTADIGAAQTWGVLRVANPGGPVTLNGSQRLTLAGLSSIDLDLSAATQDLTLNNPVTLNGASFDLSVAAGRTVTLAHSSTFGGFKKSGAGTLAVNNPSATGTGQTEFIDGTTRFTGAGAFTHRLRWSGGTAIFDGAFNMNSGDAEGLGVYKGTLVLAGGSFTGSDAGGARIFAGRTNTDSDGTIIVSNGTHRIPGGNGGDDSNSNFIGVTNAKRGRLLVEGGSLMFNYLRLGNNAKGGQADGEPDLITVNGGRLQILGMDSPFKMGSGHQISGLSTRSSRLTVNGGRFEIPNGDTLFADSHAGSSGTQEIFLNGGTWAVKKIITGASAATRTVVFNGGTLEGTNALAGAELIDAAANAAFLVRSGGAGLGAANGSDFRFSADLAEDPASPGGGLVKTGPGRAILAGANTYTGPTVISNGLLTVSGTLAVTNIIAASGAGLSLRDGALGTFAPPRLRMGTGGAPSRLELEIASSGNACDQLVIPAGAWFLGAAVELVRLDTSDPATREGDFPVLAYAGSSAPSVSCLSWGNPVPGFTCTFEVDPAQRIVTAKLRADAASAVPTWISPTGGAWAAPANWNTAPASAPGSTAMLGAALAAPGTVTLNAPFTLGSLTFDSPNAYTLAGAGALAFQSATAGQPSEITLLQGSHALTLPVALNDTLTVTVPAPATLAAAALSGPGALVKAGAGFLSLTAPATHTGGTTLSAGNIDLGAPSATLGDGPVTLAAGLTTTAGRLRNQSGAAITLTNAVAVAAANAAIDTAAGNITLTGPLTWRGNYSFQKAGVQTLFFAGTIAENGTRRINHRTGTLTFADGADVTFTGSGRDAFYMSDATASTRTWTVEPGATVRAGGLYTGSGPANEFIVNGGEVTFTGSGGESGLIRTVIDTPGTDRITVNGGSLTFAHEPWLSLGVRGGGAEITVNGGTATFGSLSFGVRADVNYSAGSTDASAAWSAMYLRGGFTEVTRVLNWMSDLRAGRTNRVTLSGGTLRLPPTIRATDPAIDNRSEFHLDGGTLELAPAQFTDASLADASLADTLGGLTALFIGPAAVIDTRGLDATITQPAQPAPGLAGALTKRGAGALTLAAGAAYTGPTAVEAGTLRFAGGTATSGLTVWGNAAVSLRNGALDTLTLTQAALAPGARVDLEFATDGTPACDRIVLPAGAPTDALVIGLFPAATTSPLAQATAFPIFSYTGTQPDVSGWTLAPDSFGFTCTFTVNTAAQTINAVLAPSDTQVTWVNPASDNWSVAANWSPAAPAASGATVLFGGAITADATVTVDGAVSVAGLRFDNAAHPYTLAGSTLTLSSTLRALGGAHTLAAPLAIAGPVAAELAPGAALTLSGPVSAAGGGAALAFSGPGALILSGTNAVPLTLDGTRLTVTAPDALTATAPITLAPGGGTLSGAPGQTLVIPAPVDGPGPLTMAGPGIIDLGANAAYTGATVSGGGTLALSTAFPSGPLTFGAGTFAFTGSGVNGQPVTIDSGTNAAPVYVDGDLQLSGAATVVSGGLFKRGPGNLAFTGATENLLGLARIGNSGVATLGADGTGPAHGAAGLSIAAGRLTLGAEGQTNRIAGDLYVGLHTTADANAETAAELVIAGGTTDVEEFTCVGRNNGSTITAPAGLTSRLTVADGTFTTFSLSLGAATTLGSARYTGRPEVVVNGGFLHIINQFYAGNTPGAAAAVIVNGGRLQHDAASQSLRLGQDGGEGILRINGGVASFANDVIVGYGGAGKTGTVVLSGGELQVKRLYTYNAASYGRVHFNGGVLKPMAGLDAAFDELTVGEGPAIIDTSRADGGSITLDATLTSSGALAGAPDGGFVKAGAGELVIARAQAYTGPTVVSNGTLRINLNGALPPATALTVLPGGTLKVNSRPPKDVAVASLTLGAPAAPAPAGLTLGYDTAARTNDTVTVAGDVAAHAVAVTLCVNGTDETAVPNGSYPLLRWTGTGPADASAFSVTNALAGKAYALSVSGGTLWLTVAPDTLTTSGAHVWTAPGGGSWSEAAKWSQAPSAGAQGIDVRFDATLAAPATVSVNQSATLGRLFLNGANAYTLAGPDTLTLDNGADPAAIQVESGAHTLAAPLALTGDTLIKPIADTALTLAGPVTGGGALVKQNTGALILASPASTFTGGVRLDNTGVTLTNGASAGGGPVAFNTDATLRVGGTGTATSGPLTANTPNPVIDVAQDATLAADGLAALYSGADAAFIKQGAGELALRGTVTIPADNMVFDLRDGTLRFTGGADYRLGQSMRNYIRTTPNNGTHRRLVIDEGSALSTSGIHTGYGTNAILVNGRLDLSGGATDLMCLRVNGADAEDTLTVGPAGLFTSQSGRFVNIGVRGPASLRVNGGTARLGSLALGFNYTGIQNFGGRWSRAWVADGGLLDVADNFIWLADSNTPHRVNWLYVQDGATARLPNTQAFADRSGWTSLILDGGILKTRGPGLAAPVAGDYLSGLKRFFINTRGGTVDTDGQSATFAQAVSAAVNARTNLPAFTKAGAGALTLAQPLAWAGPVDVQAGALRAALAPAPVETLPGGLLARYASEAGPGIDSSGNRRHGNAWGNAITAVADARGGTGLNFPAGTALIVPMDEELRGMAEYTVAAWVKIASVAGGGTATTFFTTRMSNNTAPYQFMLRVVNGRLRFMGTGAVDNGWTSNTFDSDAAHTVPAGEWFHAACAVTASGLTLYVNGQPAGTFARPSLLFCPPDRAPGDLGFGIGHPYLRTAPSGEFTGQVDDVQLYGRALTDAEIAGIASTAAPETALPDLRVANGATFNAQAACEVATLTGEGYAAGPLTVTGTVAPGDAPGTPAGAQLMAQDITLADGVTYGWDFASADVNDTLACERLTLAGAGTVDLGRAEGDLISGSFRAVLMTYDTLAGAEHLPAWTVVNAGGKGYVAEIKAERGEVVLEYQSTRGTLMILK